MQILPHIAKTSRHPASFIAPDAITYVMTDPSGTVIEMLTPAFSIRSSGSHSAIHFMIDAITWSRMRRTGTILPVTSAGNLFTAISRFAHPAPHRPIVIICFGDKRSDMIPLTACPTAYMIRKAVPALPPAILSMKFSSSYCRKTYGEIFSSDIDSCVCEYTQKKNISGSGIYLFF